MNYSDSITLFNRELGRGKNFPWTDREDMEWGFAVDSLFKLNEESG
jgi:hypothetical protein